MNNNEDEQKEINEEPKELSKWELFKKYYKEVPKFKEFVNSAGTILGVFLFCIILIATVNINKSEKKTKTATTTQVTVKYQDMLDGLLDNKEANMNITINDNKYIINSRYGNNILTGTLESIDGTYKFKIKEDNIYEIRLDEEIVNNELFKDINTSIINNSLLVNILRNNTGIKIDQDNKLMYKYDKVNINDITYSIEVIINNNSVANININNDTISYVINYV